jgi:O-antigen ligase
MAHVPQKINLLSIFTSIAIFLIPFGVLVSFSPISGVRFYLLDIIVGVIFLLTIWNSFFNKLSVLHSRMIIAFIFFAIFSVISLGINTVHLTITESLVAFSYWVRLVCYGSLMVVPFLLPEVKRATISFKLFIAGTVFTLFGYFQYFFYSDLRNLYYLGWDEHLYRFFSTFLDPNFAAAFLVLTFMLGLGLLFEKRKSFSLRLKNTKEWVLLIGLVIIIPAFFLTYSRSGFIMFGVSMVVFLILIKQIKLIIFGLLILGIGIIFVPKNLGGEGVNLLRTASIHARFESYNKGLQIFENSPLYGVGFNAYRSAQIKRNFIGKNPQTNHAGAGVSNSWLFVLVTTGIVGLILYLCFWFQVFKFIVKGSDLVKNQKFSFMRGLTSMQVVAISSLAGLFVEACFENSLFYNFLMVWIFLMIGTLIAQSQQIKE